VNRFLFVLSVCGVLSTAHAAVISPEIEEAYKQGAADWDRGDPASAMVPLKRAADGGHPAAQALFGYLLDQSDFDLEAAEYYRKSAEQGNADGMFGLAGLLVAGDVIKQDMVEARKLYRSAAEAGHEQSVVVLAMAYLQGSIGLTEADKESADALKSLQAAAKFDHLPSLQKLVEVYQKGGMGLPPDAAEAARLQKKVNELQGTDPNAPKKRRRRLQ
jgi:uncharacterized protein